MTDYDAHRSETDGEVPQFGAPRQDFVPGAADVDIFEAVAASGDTDEFDDDPYAFVAQEDPSPFLQWDTVVADLSAQQLSPQPFDEPAAVEMVEEPVWGEPAVEAVVAEEPVAEEPVTEEPVAEEPVWGAPVAETVAEIAVEEPVWGAPAVEVVAEPVWGEPAVEAVVVEEPVAAEPAWGEPAAEVVAQPVWDEPAVEASAVEAVVDAPVLDSETSDTVTVVEETAAADEVSVTVETETPSDAVDPFAAPAATNDEQDAADQLDPAELRAREMAAAAAAFAPAVTDDVNETTADEVTLVDDADTYAAEETTEDGKKRKRDKQPRQKKEKPAREPRQKKEKPAKDTDADKDPFRPRFAVAPGSARFAAVIAWIIGTLSVFAAGVSGAVALATSEAINVPGIGDVSSTGIWAATAVNTLFAILWLLAGSGIARGVKSWWTVSVLLSIVYLPIGLILSVASLIALAARDTRDWVI